MIINETAVMLGSDVRLITFERKPCRYEVDIGRWLDTGPSTSILVNIGSDQKLPKFGL